jgi:GPI-anchor transamidase subunit GAA1
MILIQVLYPFYCTEFILRILESTMRTANNLLERLHASFFFYILATPDSFLKIGKYLPSPILISVAMMFAGLRHWVDAAWSFTPTPETKKNNSASVSSGQWTRRKRPVILPLLIILTTHLAGLVLHNLISSSWLINNQTVSGKCFFRFCFADTYFCRLPH